MTFSTEASSNEGRRGSDEVSPGEAELTAFSRELAERVKSETLSRRSMQEMLKVRFPTVSEEALVRSMQAALKLTLMEGEES